MKAKSFDFRLLLTDDSSAVLISALVAIYCKLSFIVNCLVFMKPMSCSYNVVTFDINMQKWYYQFICSTSNEINGSNLT